MNKIYGEKETKIFKAVLALADRGVDLSSVKMQEVAAEADVGKSTLYEYFASKEELLAATMSFCLQHEVELLGPNLQSCDSFNALLDTLFSYADGLVQERVAAYGMLGQVFGGHQNMEKCPMLQNVTRLFNQLVEFAAKLAEKDGYHFDDTEYFGHVIFSTMMPYAVSMLRMKNMGQLNEESHKKLRAYSKKMLLKVLQ